MSDRIRYEFHLPDDRIVAFEFQFDGERYQLVDEEELNRPPWTDLAFQKCHHCPYNGGSGPKTCPAALQIAQVVRKLEHLVSYDKIELKAITPNRTIAQSTSAQEGIGSMLGLLLASSGCPHTEFLLPMARYHLPMASADETLWRASSNFMLAQYFRSEQGAPIQGFERLLSLYQNIEIVNQYMARRLRNQVDEDACATAIVFLDNFAKTFPYFLKQSIHHLKPLYASYFDV